MMFDAIRASQLAMEVDQLKLQTISQNISNMNTPAFKKQILESASFEETQALPPIYLSEINTQGVLMQTHHPLDLALSEEAYFQVQGEQGIYYTKRGDFKINHQGELTTTTGELVLSKSEGSIKLDNNACTIDTQGRIFINNEVVDQLSIVQFNANQLHYISHGLYQAEEPPKPASDNVLVLQGFLEQSNVTSMDEMIELLKISRHFESNQQLIHTVDHLLSATINQLGEENV